MKHPKFNAKMTHAVTERVILSWCAVSNAYLLSAKACHNQAKSLMARGDTDLIPLGGDIKENSGSYSTVAHDSLIYGMEMTLKAAQLIDGYHEFNKDLGIPGFVENFECGFKYVYVRPTHRLDQIYGSETSDKMKQALERVAPVEEILRVVYEILYSDTFGHLNWAPGSDYKPRSGNILHDSLRYTRHWGAAWLPPEIFQHTIACFERLNSVLPAWFHDSELKSPES